MRFWDLRFKSVFAHLCFVLMFVFAAILAQGHAYGQYQGQMYQNAPQPGASQSNYYTGNEIVEAGRNFFGTASGELAAGIENIFQQYGLPNGYILGEEGSGAIVGGLTYGEGQLFTKFMGEQTVFWQGPSLGWDFGGQASRLMILVYELDNINNLWGRYVGVSGSAYLVAGVGFHVLKRKDVILVPVRTGVGARLGLNVGYLKLTPQATWNPF